jgi:hypothetical protein|tara:strand:+ start:307 stop:450 length:144 start_codon:yes stop_codon:yes gene_type:complete
MLANMIPVHAYDAFIDADIIIEKKKPNNKTKNSQAIMSLQHGDSVCG